MKYPTTNDSQRGIQLHLTQDHMPTEGLFQVVMATQTQQL